LKTTEENSRILIRNTVYPDTGIRIPIATLWIRNTLVETLPQEMPYSL